MERRIQYGIFLLLFVAAGLSIYGFFFHATPGSRVIAKAATHIGAGDLVAAFDKQESLSDSLYLYKVLSVSGIVKKLRKTGSGAYIVFLGDRNPTTATVSCFLDSTYSERRISLMTGDSLTIWGTCAGHLSDVVLVQCIIEKR